MISQARRGHGRFDGYTALHFFAYTSGPFPHSLDTAHSFVLISISDRSMVSFAKQQA